MEQQTDRQQKQQRVIDVLNKARALELNAIGQYMNHHYNLDNQDYGEMAKNLKLIAIDEMKHAEMLAERIEELGGQPTIEAAGRPHATQDVEDLFANDGKLEAHALDAYNEFLLICRENGDSNSVRLFEELINDEQVHFNYFDSTHRHIEQLGQTYLAQVAGTSAATGIRYQGFVDRQTAPPPPVDGKGKA